MADQTRAGAVNDGQESSDLHVNPKDREILRELASQVAELAARPTEEDKKRLWYDHNALKATRPVIFCDPENGWNEIITPDRQRCKGRIARGWEFYLLKEIFWATKMRDDRVTNSHLDVPHIHTGDDWGVEIPRIGAVPGGAYTWDPPIKDFDDMKLLRFPLPEVDYEATSRIFDLANETLGDILTVRLKTAWWWSQGMTWTLISLRGLGQMMLDMYDNPDGLHRLMAYLRDGHMARLDFLEGNGLLNLNNDGAYVGSGGFGWTHELPQQDFDGKVRTKDMWGFAESQETVGVSPDLFEEFVFQYQMPLLSRFGLNCYGCCEPVDSRWHLLKQIPNLRRVSVSPWSNLEKMAEYLGDRYILSMKPNPADLAAPSFDGERIRAGLREAMRITRGCRVEVIMKDNHTICRDPRRVTEWTRIAREEAACR
jgi:hypothetical protein